MYSTPSFITLHILPYLLQMFPPSNKTLGTELVYLPLSLTRHTNQNWVCHHFVHILYTYGH